MGRNGSGKSLTALGRAGLGPVVSWAESSPRAGRRPRALNLPGTLLLTVADRRRRMRGSRRRLRGALTGTCAASSSTGWRGHRARRAPPRPLRGSAPGPALVVAAARRRARRAAARRADPRARLPTAKARFTRDRAKSSPRRPRDRDRDARRRARRRRGRPRRRARRRRGRRRRTDRPTSCAPRPRSHPRSRRSCSPNGG